MDIIGFTAFASFKYLMMALISEIPPVVVSYLLRREKFQGLSLGLLYSNSPNPMTQRANIGILTPAKSIF